MRSPHPHFALPPASFPAPFPWSTPALTGRLGLAACLAALALPTGCTLDITAPIEPPPEVWDPALNTHPDGGGFQELLNRYVREGLPGVVLLVRTPQGSWNGAAGYAKLETEDSMLPTHRHYAASVTKMYTATAVLLLAEDGLIDLDAPISTYLPESVYSPIPNGARATVRQLLSHTSGIPDFSGDLAYDLDFLNDPSGSYPTERLLSYLHGQSRVFEPGAGYFYSNANYLLLALIMDHVTGGSHAEVISHRILEPLHLAATYYKNEPEYPRPPGLVNSYQDVAGDGRLMNVSDLAVYALQIFSGNAGVIGTSADFAAFIEALLDGRVLEPASLSQMQSWGERSRYGLGLNFIETPYGPGIGHSGGDSGALAQVRRFPDRAATLVLLANGGDSGVTDRLFHRLWDEVMDAALSGL
ncbi:MAG: serine hydrolase domain-containing protein [Gemmatimonadota bacterium]|jgi:D-alanyl-D-alanine carboxypeptidase